MTKEATIREIHHRVKNNLQTVAALLRLQSRRMDAPAARVALEEATRRVAAIALVHETLSQSFDESVDFDEVADRLRAMVVEVSSGAADGSAAVRGDGERRSAPARSARCPRSWPRRSRWCWSSCCRTRSSTGSAADRGACTSSCGASRGCSRCGSRTTGTGCPPSFDPAGSASLGIAIVRTLVESELGGRITFGSLAPGTERVGTSATVRLPLDASAARSRPAGPSGSCRGARVAAAVRRCAAGPGRCGA